MGKVWGYFTLIIVLFSSVYSSADSADCAALLDGQDWQWSPDLRQVAGVIDGQVMVRQAHANGVIASHPLPNSLDPRMVTLAWSPSGDNLVATLLGSSELKALVFNSRSGEWQMLSTELPRDSLTSVRDSLFSGAAPVTIYFNATERFLFVRTRIDRGLDLAHRAHTEKDLILVFDLPHKALTAAVGYKTDWGSQLPSLWENPEDESELVAIVGHGRFINIGFERWDLHHGLRTGFVQTATQEKIRALMAGRKVLSPSISNVKYRPRGDERGHAHLLPNPDRSFFVKATLAEEGQWALDLIEMRVDREGPGGHREMLLHSIPGTFDPAGLTFRWQGQVVVIETGEGQVWYWNHHSRHLEVQVAAKASIRGDQLFLLRPGQANHTGQESWRRFRLQDLTPLEQEP